MAAALLLLMAWAGQGCAACSEAAAGCATRQAAVREEREDSNLLQAHSVLKGRSSAAEAARAPATWVAGPWGTCTAGCGPRRFRSVQCLTVYNGGQVLETACRHQRPASSASCTCGGLEVCQSALGRCPSHNSTADPAGGLGGAGGFEEVGCFEPGGQPAEEAEDPRDTSCMKWDVDAPCKSGLPFYAHIHVPLSPQRCWTFCIHRGFEISGIERNKTCRCGATVLNKQVWHSGAPRRGLAFDPDRVKRVQPSVGEACPLRVFRYSGELESDGVPSRYWNLRAQDLEYRASVVAGRIVTEAGLEDGNLEAGAGQEPDDPVSFTRRCWSGDCSKWDTPWQIRLRSPPAGVEDVWEEYVPVPYCFAPGLDAAGKEVFRQAARIWSLSTCVNFVERPGQPSDGPYVRVGNFSAGSCYFGYSPANSTVGIVSNMSINLGWCKSLSDLGSVIRQIGSAIGMKQEQKRPNSTKGHRGHGPFRSIYWSTMAGWAPQPVPAASGDDGKGDPRLGRFEYNYESMMRYGAGAGGSNFNTTPVSKQTIVGHGNALWQGEIAQAEIAQILDTHKCKVKVLAPAPMPIPTPAPAAASALALKAGQVPTLPPPPPTPAPPPTPPPFDPFLYIPFFLIPAAFVCMICFILILLQFDVL